jgi:hypothetical protein
MVIIYYPEEPTGRKYKEKDTDIEQRFVLLNPYIVLGSSTPLLH